MSNALPNTVRLPFSPSFSETMTHCAAIAEARGQGVLAPEHLLAALIEDPDAMLVFAALRTDEEALKHETFAALATLAPSRAASRAEQMARLDPVLAGASHTAARLGAAKICGACALVALAQSQGGAGKAILLRRGLEPGRALEYLKAEAAGGRSTTTHDKPPAGVIRQILAATPRNDLTAPPAPAKYHRRFEADLPRKLYLNRPQTVEIVLSQEEILSLFRPKKPGEEDVSHRLCHAITVGLAAPKGGICVETTTAQPQWVMDKPPFLSAERFGRFGFRLTATQTGSHVLALTVDCRTVDAGQLYNFPLCRQDTAVIAKRPVAAVAASALQTLLLIAVGAVLAASALFALKAMGKLPFTL